RWLTPTALAALLSIPVQTATGHSMGGGPSMGGIGGNRMGSHSAMASRSFSRNGASVLLNAGIRRHGTMTDSSTAGINSVIAGVDRIGLLTGEIASPIVGAVSNAKAVKVRSVRNASSSSGIISSSLLTSRRLGFGQDVGAVVVGMGRMVP